MSTRNLKELILEPGIRSTHFFNGRMLSGEDLTREQLAHRTRQHLLGRAAGAGVAFGFEAGVSDFLGTKTAPVLTLAPGLAVTPAGQALRMKNPIDLAVLQPPAEGAPADHAEFDDCEPLPASVYISGTGVYLLTVASAEKKEGSAPVSGLGNGLAPCNAKSIAEGVQFRLLSLFTPAAGANAATLRNEVAYLCYGYGSGQSALSDFARAPFDPANVTDRHGLRANQLTDCEVPLAALYWTTAGLEWLDLWAVRRRLVQSPADGRWTPLTGDRRRAENEAMFHQFEHQILALRDEPGGTARAVHERFSFLPPAAFLPAAFDWRRFLGAHAPAVETPLDEGLARSLIHHARNQDPVRVVPPGTPPAGAPPPVRYNVYRVGGLTDSVLITRSSLGEVVAADVAFDNRVCGLPNAPTVQRAIEELCKERCGCCSVTVAPGAGWETALTAIAGGQDAQVCFPPGEYRLDRAVELRNKGHLVFTGAGRGTRIIATRTEAALIFSGCKSVTVSNLAVMGGAARSGEGARHLNGAVTVIDCPAVDVLGVILGCPAAATRTAACLAIRNLSGKAAVNAAGTARVRGCELAVGDGQAGILLVNVGRPMVEDNVLRAGAALPWKQRVENPESRAALRRHLLAQADAEAKPGKKKISRRGAPATGESGSGSDFARAWTTALASALAKTGGDAREAAALTRKLADDFLLSGGRLPGAGRGYLPDVFGNAAERALPAGGQGIVIAGTNAGDVRVLNNTVGHFLQGIHVGFSHGDPARLAPDQAESVLIAGNTLALRLTVNSARGRHGVFVGNCDSLVIENNRFTLERTAVAEKLPIEAVRIFGLIGRRLIVRANHLARAAGAAAFDVGIRFTPLSVARKKVARVWFIGDNMLTSTRQEHDIAEAVRRLVRGLDTDSA